MLETQVDHVLFGVPALQEGISLIHSLLGTSPVLGGKHPGVGTHNALLSLGPRTYLEVIAPDPSQEVAKQDLPYGLADLKEPKLITWAVRPANWRVHVRQTELLGLETSLRNGSRMRPDGMLLEWQSALLSPPVKFEGQELTGLLPFAIEWHSSQHPADSAPGNIHLESLALMHPCPNVLARLIDRLSLPCSVEVGNRATIKATIQIEPNRFVTLT